MTRYYLQTKKTSLSYSISDSETTMRFEFIRKLDGTSIAAADIGDYMTGTFDPGTSKEEIFSIAASGVTINADGTVDVTGVVRGLKEGGSGGYSTGGFATEHGAGAVVVFSNNPQLYNQLANVHNANTFEALNIFEVAPQSEVDPVNPNDLTRLSYVQALVLGTLTTINVIVPGKAGENVALGQLVYFDDTDNEWKLCDADTSSTVENVLLGIAQGAGTNGNSIANGVLLQGVDDNQSGLTEGDTYYASNTAGGISNTPGTTEVTIGIGKTATELYFNPRFNQMITEGQKDALVGTSGTPSASNKYVTSDDTSNSGASGKIVRATGTSLPALGGENLTNVSLQETYVADGSITSKDAVAISTGGNTNVYDPRPQDTSSTGSTGVIHSTKTTWVGQAFTTPAETNLYLYTAIIKMTQSVAPGSTAYSLTCSIRATSGGLPTGADLATATAVVGSGAVSSPVTFTFPTPVVLSAGTTYAFIIRDTGAGTDVNWTFYGNTVSTNSGSTWATDTLDQVQATTITYGKTTTAGRVIRSNATASDVASNGFIGFANSTVTEGQNVVVKYAGIITGLSGLTVGSTYYLSNTGGAIALSAGSQSRKVGIAVSTTSLLIKQDNV